MDVTEGETEELAEPEPDKEGVTDGLMLVLTDAVSLTLPEDDNEDDGEQLELTVNERLDEIDAVEEAVEETVSDTDAETETLPVHELETLGDGETDAVVEPLPVTDADGVRVGVSDTDAVCVPVCVAV